MKIIKNVVCLMLVCMAIPTAFAQKSAIQSIEEYRAMLQDGNPADLFEAKGEDVWKQKRGPKNASLEKCDLGKGTHFERFLLEGSRESAVIVG